MNPMLALALARSIAVAEGFYVQGSLPQRINNPGDMKLGDRGWGLVDGKTAYVKADWDADIRDETDGCSALRRECMAILSGKSRTVPVTATIEQLARTWTGNDNAGPWCKIVAEILNLDPMTELIDWVQQSSQES